jgi:cellulose synthase/poly-beta-1,6-N-acetylglucosamine synthase-like glycosyltransferase
LTIIVPTFDEQSFIGAKLQNCLHISTALELPIRIIVVDGGSSDATCELARRFASAHPELSISVLETTLKGKIPQVNAALALVEDTGLVVSTDADAIVTSENALEEILSEFRRDSALGLVGGWVKPAVGDRLALERVIWERENTLRGLESDAFSSSMVAAPFYAFRRDLILGFPEKCIADDVWITYAALGRQMNVRYLRKVQILEMRAARNLSALYFHKLRKCQNYMSELHRFVFNEKKQRRALKFILGFKFFQMFLLPFLLPITFLQAALLCGWWAPIALFLAIYASTLRVGGAAFAGGERRGRLRGFFEHLVLAMKTVEYFVLLEIVLFVSIFTYAKAFKTSSYPKVPCCIANTSEKRTLQEPTDA